MNIDECIIGDKQTPVPTKTVISAYKAMLSTMKLGQIISNAAGG